MAGLGLKRRPDDAKESATRLLFEQTQVRQRTLPIQEEQVGFALEIVTSRDELRHLSELRSEVRACSRSTRPGATLGPGLGGTSPTLINQGLIEKIPGWKLYTLSEKGVRAARLFTAEGAPPAWIDPLVPLRNQVREREKKPIDNRDSAV
ncbi:hypothetical protein [Microbacterium arborescens]|uniref:hypothetical protein n=1 Tax=Microbacterium arborescens TaxID=33883 RepID=UPI0013B38E52|nr:hypothetical protein [Microbacterium arborescens]